MMRDQKSPQPNGPSAQQVYVPAHCVNPPPNHQMRNVNTPSIQQQQQHQTATHIHQPPLTVKYFQQQPTPHQQPQMYVTTTPAPPHQGPQQQQMQPTVEPSVHQVATMGTYQQQFFPGSQTPQPPMIKRIVGSGYQPTIVRAPPLGIQQAAQRFIRTPIDQQQQGVPQTAMFTTLGAHPQLHSPHHIMNGAAAAAAAFNRFPQAQSTTGAVARIAQQGGGNGYHIYSMPPSLSQHPQVQTMHGGLDGSQQGLQSPGTNLMRSMPPQGMLARSASVVPQVYHAVPANSHSQQPPQQQQPSLMLSQSTPMNNSSSSSLGGGKPPPQASHATPHPTHIHHQPPPPQQLNGATTTTMQTDALMQHGAGPPPHVHQQQQAVNTQQHHNGLVTAGVSANSNNHITCAPLAMTNSSNTSGNSTCATNNNNNTLPCQDTQGQSLDRLQPMQQMSTNVVAMPGGLNSQHHMNSNHPASNSNSNQQPNPIQTTSTNSKMMIASPSHASSQNQLQQQHSFAHNVTISSSSTNIGVNNSNAVLVRPASNLMNSSVVGSPVACSPSNISQQSRTSHSKSLATTSASSPAAATNLMSNMHYTNSEMAVDTSNNNNITNSGNNASSSIGINNNNNVYSNQQSNNSSNLTNDLKSCSSSASIRSTSSADSEKMTEQMEDLNSIYDDFFSTLASDNGGMPSTGVGSVKMEEERMDTTPVNHTSNQLTPGSRASFNDLESPNTPQPTFMIGGKFLAV